MEATKEVLASLEARATDTTLDELKAKGKKRVRVIRAQEIAGLMQEAVERALSASEWVSPEQVEEIVERGQKEFAEIKTNWENERQEHARLEAQLGDEKLRADELEEIANALKEEVQRLENEVQELKQGAPAAAAAPAADATTAMMMMKLMEEISALKAGGASTPQQAGDPELGSKLDAIAGALDKKLETFGKKMGISAAVDSTDVDFKGLFEKDMDSNVETNMGDVEMEKREGKGIAANLARMKKLRGGN